MNTNELTETNKILETYPYPPFQDPARNLAERLIILGHLAKNHDIWGTTPERRKRYWSAYIEHIGSCANTDSLSTWWNELEEEMGLHKLNSTQHLHEKNLLLQPEENFGTTEYEILASLRKDAPYLIDRVRVWSRTKYTKENQVAK